MPIEKHLNMIIENIKSNNKKLEKIDESMQSIICQLQNNKELIKQCLSNNKH